MDTTTTAAPLASVWDVLSELAACGQDNLLLGDAGRLASRIVGVLHRHLLCPWGLLLLQRVEKAASTESWGLDAERQERFLARNGHSSVLPPDTIELYFEHEGAPAGTLLLGGAAQLAPGFLGALRQQIELLIALQRREAVQREELSQQQQRARELFVLYENGQVISSTLSIEPMLARVAENITLAMNADVCALHLLDQNDPTVLYEAVSYSGEGTDRTGVLRYERAKYRPIADLLHSGEMLAVEDVERERDKETQTVLRLFGYRSALLLMLKVRDQTLGLLNVGFAVRAHRFSSAERNFARTLASQVATAVLNARLYESEQRRTSELTALQTVSQRLGADLDLDETLAALFEGVQSLVTTFAGAQICLYDPADQLLHVATQRGLAPGQPEVASYRLSEGLSGWVARYRRALRLSDMRRPPVRPTLTRLARGAAVQSYLGVPLQVGDQLVGTVELFGERPNTFSAVDERLLMIIAGPAARAITNARIYGQADEHLRSRLQQLTALQRISRQLTATLSLDSILKFALEEVVQATPANQSYIALRVGTEEELKVEDAKSAELRGYIALREGRPDDAFQVIAAAGYEELANQQILGRTLRDPQSTALLALTNGDAGLADELAHDDRIDGLGLPVASALALPIFYEDHVIGVINLHSQMERAFNHDAVEFGRALADQMALAIGNAQRYDEQRRQRELLQKRSGLLNEVMGIGESLRADLSLEQVLDQIAFSTVETAGYGTVVFNLFTPDDAETLRPLVGAGVPLPELERIQAHPVPLRLVQMLCDPRFRVGRCFYVPGADAHELTASAGLKLEDISAAILEDNRLPGEWQSDDLLIIPLYSTRAKLIGTMVADNPYNRQRPTPRSVEPLEIFADQAAIAIENASLLDEARRQASQMRALFRVGAATVSTLDLDDLLERVYTEIVEYMGVPSFFYVASHDSQSLSIRFELFKEDGQELATFRKKVMAKTGLTGWIIDQGEQVHIRDLTVERSRLPVPVLALGKDVRSWVGIPLRSHNEIIGVLSMQHFAPNAFNERHIEFLSSLGNNLAIAMENVRLFNDTRRKVGELSTLNRISQTINATLELDDLLVALHRGIGDVLDASNSSIALYDAATRRVTLPVVWQNGQPVRNATVNGDIDSLLSERVVETRRPLLLCTPQEIEAATATTLAGRQSVSAWLGVPIIQGNAVYGVINVQSAAPYAYTEDDERFLMTVASQAATAIANARLFAERERRLQEVSVMKDISSTVSSTLDLQDVLERFHAELGRVIDVSTSFLALYDAESNTVSYPIARDRGMAVAFTPVDYTAEAFGMSYWVMEQGQPLLAHTYEETLHYPQNEQFIRLAEADAPEQSFLVAPIMAGDKLLGVINIQSYQQHAFTEDDMHFVVATASQVAVAINNARLYQQRGRQIEELETFNQIGQELSAASRLEELSDLLYRQTSRLLNTTTFYIALYNAREGSVTFTLYYERGQRRSVEPVSAPDSLMHYVIRTREPLLLQGSDKEAQIAARDIRSASTQSRSWLGVPMIAADRVLGLICVEDDERDNAYDKDDVRLLTTIASWGATAFENVRLLGESRQSVRDLTALNDSSVVLAGTLDATEVLRVTASGALELLQADVCVLVLFDAHGRKAQQVVLDRANPDLSNAVFADVPLDLIEELKHSDHALSVTDLAATPSQHLAVTEYGLRGSIADLIGARDQPIGMIIVSTRAPHIWQEREIALLSILANQSGKALESARLFQSEQSRRVVADMLREVAQMLTSLRSLDEILALILDQLARVVQYDSAALMLREGDMLRVAALRGFDPNSNVAQMVFNLADDSTLARIVTTRRPMVVADAQNSVYFVAAEGSDKIRGWVGAPLLLDDEVIGLLTVDSSTVGAYSDEDADLAFALASQAAQAIRNARLFDEVRAAERDLKQRVEERTVELAEANTLLLEEKERLQAVHEITLDLTESLDLNEILVKTLALASKAVSARRGSIMLRNSTDGALVCQAVLGGDGAVHIIENPISFSDGLGLSGWVMEYQQPVCISDVHTDARWIYEEGRADEVRSVVAVPLMAQDGALGVLILRSPEVDFFSLSQVQLLVTIASEVAIVINNANLFSLVTNIATEKSDLLRKQQEETTKNQAILEGLGEGVLVLDEDQRIILFNLAAEQILDIPAARVLGQQLLDVRNYGVNSEMRERSLKLYDGLEQALQELVAQDKPHSRVIELPGPTQSIVINVASVRGANDVLYGRVVVLRDITREIESDRAKRDFISSVSHELRTPLTSIKGYVDLLILGTVGALNEGQASFLSVVKNNTKRLMDLIDDLLEIGRIDANKIELNFGQVDVRDIINDVLQSLRAEIERKSLKVGVEIQNGLPMIEADPRRLLQVVMNLISNAVKYTFAGGTITVQVFLNPAGLLEVDVQDTGVGISPEQQQHLFRRFYRADNPLRDEAGGTGLGLSIAKSFVELHGGEMWVRSATGKGSTFSFIVPLEQPEQLAVVAEL